MTLSVGYKINLKTAIWGSCCKGTDVAGWGSCHQGRLSRGGAVARGGCPGKIIQGGNVGPFRFPPKEMLVKNENKIKVVSN